MRTHAQIEGKIRNFGRKRLEPVFRKFSSLSFDGTNREQHKTPTTRKKAKTNGNKCSTFQVGFEENKKRKDPNEISPETRYKKRRDKQPDVSIRG